ALINAPRVGEGFSHIRATKPDPDIGQRLAYVGHVDRREDTVGVAAVSDPAFGISGMRGTRRR
ncbi:MAG: hypothetical protein WBW37_10360, partial [Methyloceanibacter sp.]